MKSSILLVLLFSIFLFNSTVVANNRLTWQAVKTSDFYGISFWADVDDANEIYVKGPGMTEYQIVDINEGTIGLGWRIQDMTLVELNTQSQGTWYVKVTFDDLPQNISEFAIIGGVYESEFPEVPKILYPCDGDKNITAEHCTFVWDPNGAEQSSSVLSIGAWGDGFVYDETSYYGPIELTDTTWNPGWLELGPANMKIGYWVFMWGKRELVSNESGTEIDWENGSPISMWLSGEYVEFEVTKSIDINDDDTINFYDLAIMLQHWLESK